MLPRMVAYSFNRQFIAPIIEGTKRQTIRAVGKRRHAEPGSSLQLYIGMRTKYCRLIGRASCYKTAQIELSWRERRVLLRPCDGGVTRIYPAGFDEFAEEDGFASGDAMAEFWERTHPGVYPFVGLVIRWIHFAPASLMEPATHGSASASREHSDRL